MIYISNNSLSSTFKKTQETINGTRNLTQQDFPTPSQFVNKEIVETKPTTTERSISPVHATLKTRNKKSPLPKNNTTTNSQTIHCLQKSTLATQ